VSKFKVHNHVAHRYKKRIIKKRGDDVGLYQTLKMLKKCGNYSAHKALSEILRSDLKYKDEIQFGIGIGYGYGLASYFVFNQTIQGSEFWWDAYESIRQS